MPNHLDDDREIIPDGGKVRVSLLTLDALQRAVAGVTAVVDHEGRPAGHRPGYVFARDAGAADEASDRAYAEYCRRLGDAWRQTPPASDHTPNPNADGKDAITDDRERAYRERNEYLQNSWKARS